MYPEKAGFSPRNVRRMRDFYLAYKAHPQMMSLALQLNWTQNVVILETCNEATRAWYMRSAKRNAWTKSELMAAIENEAHQGTPVDNADPWYTENYVQMWMQVQVGCKGLLESLKKSEEAKIGIVISLMVCYVQTK